MINFLGMQFRPSGCFDRLAAVNWKDTPLGHPDGWPAVLKTSVQLCLNSWLPMCLVWGRNHVIIYNDAYQPIVGDAHPRAYGAALAQVYPDNAGFLHGRVRDLMVRGEVSYEDHLLLPRARDGVLEEAYFSFSFNPLSDERGVSGGVLCVASETTEAVLQQRRSSTLSRLAEEMARLPAAEPIAPLVHRAVAANPLDFSRVALIAVDAGGAVKLLWSNPRSYGDDLPEWDRLLGYLASHRGGKHAAMLPLGGACHALTLVDDGGFGGRAFALVVEPGNLVRRDAGYLKFLNLALDTVAGAVYRIFSERRTYRDMSRQLSDRDRMYRLLFEQSRDGIMLLDSSGRVAAANPAASRLLGYPVETLVGLGRNEVVADDDCSITRALAEYRAAGSFEGILRFRRSDGTLMHADVSAAMFSDQVVGTDATIALFRDARERLQNQERLAAAARLEAIGQITGGISHDFNNLLNVIIQGAEDVVSRLPEGEPGRRSADLVLEASLKAADLTRQLLAFGRRQSLAARALDVGETLRSMDQILASAIGEGIEVHLRVAEGVCAFADPSQLQNAVLNLCLNARDAMPGGGQLVISGRVVSLDPAEARGVSLEPGDYVEIEVADTGVGIEPDQVDRVVEPFYTTKPSGTGTGLGLSMVFGFVNQSGGSMRLRSEPGRGTAVQLYLPPAPRDEAAHSPAAHSPAARSPAANASAAASPQTPAQAASTGRVGSDRAGVPGAHLLVVEDNELLASMLVRILEGAGYRVSLCRDGEQALILLDADAGVALVVTDIQLGAGMDGWTLAETVKRRRPGTPVVTMSGFAPAEGPGAGARLPTLRKPFRPQEILSVIDHELAGAR